MLSVVQTLEMVFEVSFSITFHLLCVLSLERLALRMPHRSHFPLTTLPSFRRGIRKQISSRNAFMFFSSMRMAGWLYLRENNTFSD